MTADPDGHPTRPTSGPEYWAIMARENVAGMESVLAYKFEQVERLQAQVDALEQRIADLEEVLARERSLSDGISDRYSDLEQRIVELEGERLPAAALRALEAAQADANEPDYRMQPDTMLMIAEALAAAEPLLEKVRDA